MIAKLVALTGLVSCASASPGTRFGSLDDAADPVLRNLELAVRASQNIERALAITVMLEDPEAHGGTCFHPDTSYRLRIDGQLIGSFAGGGASRGQMISGMPVGEGDCTPAYVTWTAPAGYVRTAETEITVEHANATAVAVVANLTTPRELRMTSTSVRPGDRVSFEWWPHDEWSGFPSAPEVHIYQPDELSVHAPVKVDLPRFTFTMPDVRPGPVNLGLYHLDLQAHPKIRTCRGVRLCATIAALGPPEVTLEVLARR